MNNQQIIDQAAGVTLNKESLEADGSITVYSLESGRVVAQYEGLEVHEAMVENGRLRERLAALEAVANQAITDWIPLLSWVDGNDAAVEMVLNIANCLGAAMTEGGKQHGTK